MKTTHEHIFEDRLMGSDLVVSIVAPSQAHARHEYERAKALGDAYEQRFSRFIPQSELSQLNEKGEATVSSDFIDAISVGFSLYRATDGIFNPLVQIARFGYNESFDTLIGDRSRNIQPYDTQLSSIIIDETGRNIHLGQGQKLDVGGFLKGLVAERMAKSIRNATGVIVNIGGDIYTTGKDAHGAPFTFDVYNPINDSVSTVVPVTNSAIATSGTYRRVWQTNGKTTHHILAGDGTGNPDSDLVSATIVAPTGHEADAYATVAIIIGSEKAIHLIEQKGFSYVFITTTGKVLTNI